MKNKVIGKATFNLPVVVKVIEIGKSWFGGHYVVVQGRFGEQKLHVGDALEVDYSIDIEEL